MQFFSALHEFGRRVFHLDSHISGRSSYTSVSVMDTLQSAESLWLFAALFSTLVTVIHIFFPVRDARCSMLKTMTKIDF